MPAALATPGLHGVQPSFAERVLPRIVDSLTRFRTGREFGEKPTVGETVPEFAEKGMKVWEHIKKGMKGATYANYLSDVKLQALVTAQVAKNDSVTEDELKGVAQLAQKTLPKAKQTEDVKTGLDVKRFATLLEGFILAKTGVALDVSVNPDTQEIKRLKVGYIHLAYVNGNSRLWTAAMTTPKLADLKIPTPNLQAKIRARLYYIGPQANIWEMSNEKKGFQFSDAFVNELAAWLRNRSTQGAPKELGTPKDYTDTQAKDGKGIRLSNHGDLDKRNQNDPQFRDSHHTTQFLLVEFFRNRNKGVLAFPGSLASYAPTLGLTPNGGGLIDAVGPSAGGIDLKKLDGTSGRGNGMPAILISRETHRRGRLHINAPRDADDDAPEATRQAGRVQARFANALEAEHFPELAEGVRSPGDPAKLKGFTDLVGDPARAPAAQKAIIKSMKAVYRWMYHDVMEPALALALPSIERAYYEDIMAEAHPPGPDGKTDFVLSDSMINKIISDASTQNRNLMKDWESP